MSALDRLYLGEMVPTLILWGLRDPFIPLRHAETAHRGMPGSRLQIFAKSGHFPHLAEPVRFARALVDFIDASDPRISSSPSKTSRGFASVFSRAPRRR